MKRLLVVLLPLILILFACSNPQDASKSNFKKILQGYHHDKLLSISVSLDFPVEIDTTEFKYNHNSKKLNELEKTGFLSSTEFMRKGERKIMGDDSKHLWKKYSLTEKGKSVSSKYSTKGFMGTSSGTNFCYGKGYVIHEILNFTEPANMWGHQISKVSYTLSCTHIEDWAKNFKDIDHNVLQNINSLSEPLKATATLVLTNNGWIHEKLLSK